MKARLPMFAAALVFCATAALAIGEAHHQGISGAENDYLDHIDAIERWFGSVRSEGLGASILPHDPARPVSLLESARDDEHTPFWEARRAFNPHPPLFKYLALLSRTLLRGLPFPVAERVPTALIFAGACTALFWTLQRREGWVAGLVGVAALATMPRFVSFSGFCTPDLHIAAAWLWTALAMLRFEETRQRRWWVAAAAAFAFGLCSKLSMLPLLAPLAVLTALWRWKDGARAVVAAWLSLAALLGVAITALTLTYPFLWPAPLSRLLLMIEETRKWGALVPFSAMFFGEVMPYTKLPWYFAPTIIALVVPPLTLGLALFGIVRPPSRDKLWQTTAVIVGFWLLLELLPNTPKYDNERGMMALFPFLALFTGLGAARLCAWIHARMSAARPLLVSGVLGCALPLAMVAEFAAAHPFPLSYFSPVFGGAEGATRLGFEPTYAMEVLSPDVLAEFQAHIPQGAGVTVRPLPNQMMPFLQRRGLLRADLNLSAADGPFFILVLRHGVLLEDRPIAARHGALLSAVERDGVALAELWYMPPAPPVPPR